MTPKIDQIIEEQGWSTDSILGILWNYLEAQADDGTLLDHFRSAQLMENQAELGPDDPEVEFWEVPFENPDFIQKYPGGGIYGTPSDLGPICQLCRHREENHKHEGSTKWCKGASEECDCPLFLGDREGFEDHLPKFHTSDGFVFTYFQGRWVDDIDPDKRDMSYRGDLAGPIGAAGNRVSGRVLCCDRDTDGDGNCPIHKAPGKRRDLL
jgi:hypothetical protein